MIWHFADGIFFPAGLAVLTEAAEAKLWGFCCRFSCCLRDFTALVFFCVSPEFPVSKVRGGQLRTHRFIIFLGPGLVGVNLYYPKVIFWHLIPAFPSIAFLLILLGLAGLQVGRWLSVQTQFALRFV